MSAHNFARREILKEAIRQKIIDHMKEELGAYIWVNVAGSMMNLQRVMILHQLKLRYHDTTERSTQWDEKQ